MSESYYPLDSASGSSASEGEDEPEPAEEPEANEPRVATRRVRIWALAQSVEGGASVALYSKHSAVMPDRIFRSRVAFATARRGSSVGMAKDGLSAEGRAWEWMYGGGPEVPGFSTDAEPVLGGVFERVREGMGCALCKASLELVAGEFVCGAGHIFGKFNSSSPVFLTLDNSIPFSCCDGDTNEISPLRNLCTPRPRSLDFEAVRPMREAEPPARGAPPTSGRTQPLGSGQGEGERGERGCVQCLWWKVCRLMVAFGRVCRRGPEGGTG